MTKQTRKGIDKEELGAKLDALLADLVTDPDRLAEFSRAWAGGFHRHSALNYFTAWLQRPEAGVSLLAGFRQWEEKGRHVIKGEKAIYIRAPRIVRDKDSDDEDARKLIGFIWVPVFDVAQTDGEPVEVAAKRYVIGEAQNFDGLAALAPVPVHVKPASITAGQTDGESIVVANDDKNSPQAVATLFHEWAHVLLHFGADRSTLSGPQKELEAEAVSFIVCAATGIDNTGSKYYIGGWTKDTAAGQEVRATKIIATAQKILAAIEDTEAAAASAAA